MTDKIKSKNLNENPDRLNQHRAFFGRVSGKRLHRGQRELFDSLLPQLKIDLPEVGNIDPKEIFGSDVKQRIMEIGYGGGEHLARIAKENPQNGYVGCEFLLAVLVKFSKPSTQKN